MLDVSIDTSKFSNQQAGTHLALSTTNRPAETRPKSIRGHSRPFAAIRGHSRPFAVIRGMWANGGQKIHSRPFAAIRGHSRPFAAIRGHSRHFELIGGGKNNFQKTGTPPLTLPSIQKTQGSSNTQCKTQRESCFSVTHESHDSSLNGIKGLVDIDK